MRNKIVIICHEPLTKRIRSNFYIDDLIQAGFVLEYWDVSQYVFPGINLIDQVEEPYIIHFNNLDSIRERLEKTNIDDTLFIVELFQDWKNRHLFKLLSDLGCFTIRIDMYGNTDLNVSFRDKVKHLDVKRIFAMVNRRIRLFSYGRYAKFYHIKGFDRLFSSSSKVIDKIDIHHPDYELHKKSELLYAKKEDVIVFLDVFFPLHPDLLYMVKVQKVSAENYRRSLNRFFDLIEDKYKLPVVIAAHPKADYTGGEFGNRKIIKGETVRLVRESAFVLLHSSNSVAFAILNDKPFELITNKEYNKISYLRNVQKKLGIVLDKPIYDIDKLDIRDFRPSKMDEAGRYRYVYSYLTSKNISELTNLEILLARFKTF